MTLLNNNKRYLAGLIGLLLPILLFSQTQYDYMDDGVVSGGADRVLNGIILIIGIIVLAFIVMIVFIIAIKIYYWFYPLANPENKRKLAAKEKENEIAKERALQLQKLAVLNNEKVRKKNAVDLGLSVMWADTNLFAESQADIGVKFAWGDIIKRTTFQAKNCTLNGKWEFDLHKILGNNYLSICGNKEFDAASSLWGKKWRMPLYQEIKELIEKCEWQWITVNGVKGYKIIGNNGNSIFLPSTGKIEVGNNISIVTGEYWSGVASRDCDKAKFLSFDDQTIQTKDDGIRWHGLAIRPVWSSMEENMEIDGFTLSSYGKVLIHCNNTEEVCSIPYGVKIICKSAFKKTKKIKKLVIPNSVEEIESMAFEGLEIESVDIPKSIVRWGQYAFSFCKKLKEVTFETGLTKLGLAMFYGCESLENIIIPDSIRDIDNETFYGCSSLKNVKLPSKLNSLGYEAFKNCENLTKVELPNTLIGLHDSTFENCYSLSNVKIPEGITVISSRCFAHCESLIKLRLPYTIIHIDKDSFKYCYNLELEVPNSKESYYKKLELENINIIDVYKVQNTLLADGLKSKAEEFIRIQNYKREQDDYQFRKSVGLLTKEEYDNEYGIYLDIMNVLDRA